MGGVKGGDLFLPVDFHCVRGFENEREEGMGGLSFGFSFDVFLLCLYVWVFIYLIGDLFFGGGRGGIGKGEGNVVRGILHGWKKTSIESTGKRERVSEAMIGLLRSYSFRNLFFN